MENVDLSKDGRAALRALLWPHHFLRPRPDSPILKPPPLPPQSGAGNREAVPPPGPQPPSLPEVDKTGILDH
jgi:hypothetical protein